ncbi:hypothetical protein ACQKM2_39610 [Streptomyces sp. NPDC004126]
MPDQPDDTVAAESQEGKFDSFSLDLGQDFAIGGGEVSDEDSQPVA